MTANDYDLDLRLQLLKRRGGQWTMGSGDG